MSASHDAIARVQSRGHPRTAALAALPVILAVLTAGIVSADLPPGVTRLSAADAERAGSTIHLLRQTLGASTLVEVEPQATGLSLLAISADGGQVALANEVGELSGSLTLARADGVQLRIQLPGLLAAGFAADMSWLAVIDGRGALWRVDTDSGRAEQLADGPFLGSPIASEDGSLVLLAVPSVEAPYWSRLVRVAQATGTATPISDDELVYAAFPLDDGSLAIVAHEPGHTLVRQLVRNSEQLVADLGPGVINVAVARDGRHIAYERADDGIFLIDAPGSPPRSVGIGSRPCFGADGVPLLVRRGTQSLVLAMDGSVLAVADQLAGIAGSAGCLP